MDPRPHRETRLAVAGVLLLVLAMAGCGEDTATSPAPVPTASSGPGCGGPIVQGTPALSATLVTSGLRTPVDVQSLPGDRSRLFVAEQGGRIRVVRGATLVGTPFLDISARISGGGERGLLGLAFHPQYAQNGRFYVNYTNQGGDTVIAEFRAPAPAADVADPATERVVLFVQQPFSNHNGGALAFGPDGRLYIALGDGGSGGDPFRNGQSLSTPLGKILRVDVDGAAPFAVPSDNPFVSTPGAFPAIWAYGLRNPWRFSFDRVTGDLYIGDVGQSAVEEIDVGLASRRGGENYGWNVMEGSRCFRPSTGCATAGLTLPVVEYSHADGCSVTGGVVYRGCRMPGYAGTYFYGDFCSGLIRSFRLANGVATDTRDWTGPLGRNIGSISSFGVDADGEVLILDYDGELYRITPAS